MNIQPFCSFNGQLTKENVINAHQKWEALPQSHSYSMGVEIHPSKPDLSKRRLEKLPISSGYFLGQTVASSQDPVELTPGAANAQEGFHPCSFLRPVGWRIPPQTVVIGNGKGSEKSFLASVCGSFGDVPI